MKLLATIAAVAVLGATGAAYAGTTAGDAARGRTVFARCASCHDVASGANRIGPSLKGVVGRRSAAAAGFAYSPALRGKNVTWTRASLDTFLTAPARFAPGTRMTVAVPNAKDRADLIAYLATVR